jgi:adenine phosphoribosyltransferase
MPANNFYELKIAGITRKLKKIKISEDITIASFVMLGDTELVEKTAEELYTKIPSDVEMLVCPEAKGIPLTHVIANKLGIDYVIIRKSVKGYMENPVIEKVQSITTREPQIIVLDGVDADRIRGRKVCIIDDVVSTGGSLTAVEKLLEKAGSIVKAKAAVLLEEGGYESEDLIYLEKLPVFKNGN